jgi:hypothetical protein
MADESYIVAKCHEHVGGTLRATLWLIATSEGKSEGELTPEKEKEYSKPNTIFCGTMIGALAESLQDTCVCYKPAKEMWDTLNTE